MISRSHSPFAVASGCGQATVSSRLGYFFNLVGWALRPSVIPGVCSAFGLTYVCLQVQPAPRFTLSGDRFRLLSAGSAFSGSLLQLPCRSIFRLDLYLIVSFAFAVSESSLSKNPPVGCDLLSLTWYEQIYSRKSICQEVLPPLYKP